MIALASLLVGVAVVVRTRAIGRECRASGYALRATAFVAIVLTGTTGIRLALQTQLAVDATLLAYEAALCMLAAALLAGLARAAWERAPVTDLVLEPGERRLARCLRESARRDRRRPVWGRRRYRTYVPGVWISVPDGASAYHGAPNWFSAWPVICPRARSGA
jgi:hypothetical protein